MSTGLKVLEKLGEGYGYVKEKAKEAEKKEREVAEEIKAKTKMVKDAEVEVKGFISNTTFEDLVLQETKEWSGSCTTDGFPATILDANNNWFIHVASTLTMPRGSKGAVVYVSKEPDEESSNAWVVAWSVPGDGYNKIYAEAGQMSKYPKGGIDWQKIESKLDGSSKEVNVRNMEDRLEVKGHIGDDAHHTLFQVTFAGIID
ncbi:jasmonate-induced protein homolog [Silene latifolia]|uniref:jasmonate-induced protein homolog n=1 Tax=Silene latifolia TaxID=37657 RepID=UPI003D77F25B